MLNVLVLILLQIQIVNLPLVRNDLLSHFWKKIFYCLIVDPCEEWLSGMYNVTVMICNGECNSHHPHSQVYDTIKNSFQID